MKRLNPKTNKPFVIGEAREDGYRFDGYITARIKPLDLRDMLEVFIC